jgi:hypothetical protein
VKTTAGPVTVQRPKLRGTTDRFASQLVGTGVVRTNPLEAGMVAGAHAHHRREWTVIPVGEDAPTGRGARG